MQYEFSSSFPRPDQLPLWSETITIDELIKKYNKEIDDFYNGKSLLTTFEIKKIEKRVTTLQSKKQTAEVKALVTMELIAYTGHMAMLDQSTVPETN